VDYQVSKGVEMHMSRIQIGSDISTVNIEDLNTSRKKLQTVLTSNLKNT
jgi:hypothetical protein